MRSFDARRIARLACGVIRTSAEPLRGGALSLTLIDAHWMAVARGDEPADLVLAGGKVLSVFTKEWLGGDGGLKDGPVGRVRSRERQKRSGVFRALPLAR